MSAPILAGLGKLGKQIKKLDTDFNDLRQADARKIVRNFVLGLNGSADSTLLEDYLQDSVNLGGWNAVLTTQTDIEMIAELAAPMGAVAGSQTAINKIVASSIARNTVTSSTVAMGAVSASSIAMDIMTDSTETVDLIVSSTVAMNAITNSATAMDKITTSAIAMDAVSNSTLAMSAVENSSIAIGKFIISKIGLDPTSYNDIDSVAANTTAMNAVVASTTTMDLVTNNTIAMEAFFASWLAREIIWDSPTASSQVMASSHRQWLLDNHSITHLADGADNWETRFNGKCFVLKFQTYGPNNGGNGSYRYIMPGSSEFTSTDYDTNWVDRSDRVHVLQTRSTQSHPDYDMPHVVYVPMESVL